jgi:hypothetical protein
MDSVGVRWSLGIVLVGYLYLALFGFLGANVGHEADEPAPGTAGH